MRSTAESSPVRYLPVAASYHRASSCRRSFSAPSEPGPTLAEVGQIVIGFAHHAPLDRALARIAGEQGRPRRPTLPDMFDNRRGFGEREIVVDQDRHAAARVERPEFRRLQVAGVERQRLAMIGNSIVFKREPDPPRIARA